MKTIIRGLNKRKSILYNHEIMIIYQNIVIFHLKKEIDQWSDSTFWD